ncbi:MAG TPA: hypothetical protein V6D12_04960 [Candidatus Obscuribacterales bacterium]
MRGLPNGITYRRRYMNLSWVIDPRLRETTELNKMLSKDSAILTMKINCRLWESLISTPLIGKSDPGC